MKKLFSLLLLSAFVLTGIACSDEDDNGNGNGQGGQEATALEGHWAAVMDYRHPLDITFQGNTYIWHVSGISPLKETGTFTLSGDMLELHGQELFERGMQWQQQGQGQGSVPVETGEWEKKESPFDTHRYKVLSHSADALNLQVIADGFYPADMVFYMLPANQEQSLTPDQLRGTWEGQINWEDEPVYANGYKYRLAFNGTSYTLWRLSYNTENGDGQPKSTLVANKEGGTWTHVNGKLHLTPTYQIASYAITNMSPLQYSYYDIDPATWEWETSQWYATAPDLVFESDWTLYLAGNNLLVVPNMDLIVFDKK